jgi:hypothetical protein
MKATIIREPWISLILRGEKTWEMRSQPAAHRGLIGLIRKGSGHVVAAAQLVNSLPPLNVESYADTEPFHRVPRTPGECAFVPSIREGIARACRGGLPVRIGKHVKHGLDKGNDARKARE